MSTALAAPPPAAPVIPLSIVATPVVRRWRYKGVTLEDPLPGRSLEAVRRIHATNYAAVLNAKIDGPTYEGGVEVYSYTPQGGTFG
ncbi:MAG TPA: PRTRC system protein C [Longimicrobiaceae bacterium]|jgi:PRTRC genetic system protein C|nr:PRTRC system protein C [Longimicrobiaceae bacterium]